MFVFKNLTAALFVTFLVSCGSLSKRVVVESEDLSKRNFTNFSIQDEVDHLANPLIASGELNGLAVGVLLPDGQTQFYGYGKASDLADSETPKINTVFQVGSITKVFVASVLSVLIKEGALTGEETIRSILPESVSLSEDASKITLNQLATHTSGLPREPVQFRQLGALLKYQVTGQNLYGYIDEKFIYEYLSDWENKHSHEYVYSNIGYGLLGHLLELKMNAKLDDLLQKKILKPLSLNSTTMHLNDEQKARLAAGHVGDSPYFVKRGTPLGPWDMGQIMQGTGAMFSSVEDLLKFAKFNLDLEQSNLNQSLSVTRQSYTKNSNEDLGMTWVTQSFSEGQIKITYVHGMTSGYSGYLAINEKSKIAVVALSNSFNWDDKIGHNLMLRLSYAEKAHAVLTNHQNYSNSKKADNFKN